MNFKLVLKRELHYRNMLLVPLANFVITFPVFMLDCDKAARVTVVF